MNHSDTWFSSYRLIMALIQEVDTEPIFTPEILVGTSEETNAEARWDVAFCRLSGIQEYGWHAGIEALIWASDAVKEGLSDLNWNGLMHDLGQIKGSWTDLVIEHAKKEDAYFSLNVDQRYYSETAASEDAP